MTSPFEDCVTDRALRGDLLARRDQDAAARWAAIRGETTFEPVAALDRENTEWLRAVLDEHGWPDAAMVGHDGAHAAWLLAQHADADPAIQRRCLDLLTTAVGRGLADARDLAYLTDRVLLKEVGYQLYGTQCTTAGGAYAPDRLKDPDGVDDRRAEVGLPPLAEYLKVMEQAYGPPRGPTATCPDCSSRMEIPGIGESTTCPGCGRSWSRSR